MSRFVEKDPYVFLEIGGHKKSSGSTKDFVVEGKNCGTGAGGFKPGNRCARGGGKTSLVGSSGIGTIDITDPKSFPPRDPMGHDTTARFRDHKGNWTPEREVLHGAIIAKYLGQAKPHKKPVMYLMGGGTASGKSHVMKQGLIHTKGVKVDADEIKALLPEYRQAMETGKHAKSAATYVHKESNYLAEKILAAVADNGSSVVLDGTGDGNWGKIHARIDAARRNGMPVRADFVTVPTKVAIARAKKRAKETGRHVPTDFIHFIHERISQQVPEAIEKGIYDRFRLWDNSGKQPILVAEAKGTNLTVKDKKLWDDFVEKGRYQPPPEPTGFKPFSGSYKPSKPKFVPTPGNWAPTKGEKTDYNSWLSGGYSPKKTGWGGKPLD